MNDRKGVADCLQTHWNQFLGAAKLENERINHRLVQSQICQILVDGKVGNCILFIKNLQSSLYQIEKDFKDPSLRSHFSLLPSDRIKKIYLHQDQGEEKTAFLIQFEKGRSVVCFPPDFRERSPVIYDPNYPLMRLPAFLSKQGEYRSESKNCYWESLSIDQIQKEIDLVISEKMPPLNKKIKIDLHFLNEKIVHILAATTHTPAEKRKIMDQAIQNHSDYIKEAILHIETDLKEDEDLMAEQFNLSPDSVLKEIQFLGKETHHRGKTPLLLIFEGGNRKSSRIVYKPRSLLPEKAICGKEKSLFAVAGLPTFHVHDKKTHGYVEFLINEREQNTFEREEELRGYLASFKDMEVLISCFKGSDCHGDNVITQNKKGHLVDLEVMMGPLENPDQRQVMQMSNQVMWYFNEESRNRIWLSEELAEKLDLPTFDKCEIESAFELYPLLAQLPPSSILDQQKELVKTVEEWRPILAQSTHRCIPISTLDLNVLIGVPKKEGLEQIIDRLTNALRAYQIEPLPNYIDLVTEQFDQDILNHDVPIFYYSPSKGEFFYKEVLIGRKKSKPGSEDSKGVDRGSN